LRVIQRAGDRLGDADALNLSGSIAAAQGDSRKALGYHDDARSRYAAMGNRRGEATALHHAGVATLAAGSARDALLLLSRALEIRQQVGLRDAAAETLYRMAVAERRLGRFDRARSHLRGALAITEDVRGRVAGEYSRATYLASRRALYAEEIDLLMELHERHPSGGYAAEAFLTAERERARSLLDTLQEVAADVRQGVDNALLDEEQALRRAMNLWAYRLASLAARPGADGAAADARRMLAEKVAEYRLVESRIRAASGGYARLVTQPPLTVAELQGLLDEQSILLRFFVGDTRGYVWLIGPTATRVAQLPNKTAIDQLSQRVRQLATTPPPPGSRRQAASEFDQAAGDLSTLLLGAFADMLGDRQLIVVAEGSLQLIPFAALPEPGGTSPLIVRHEIVMLPSATTLAMLRRQVAAREPARKSLALFVDPVYEPNDPRIVPRGDAAVRWDSRSGDEHALALRRLLFSRREGDWILDVARPVEPFVASGFSASRATFNAVALNDYRIVHFATHALADDIHPELSGIALSMVDQTGAPQDGFVRLHEIHQHLNLRAELVVLSACDTAVGKDFPGEGLVGLARAVLTAGSIRVVASLFKVHDPATAQLMREMYRAMLNGKPSPAAALREAQLRMLASPQWQDPYFWSAFVLIGEPM
jgi:CHAT domain-containing protein